MTLTEHLAAASRETAGLALIVERLAEAGRAIARELGRAALVDRLGTTGETNVQGEAVKKLDVWANEAVVRALRESRLARTLISEEMAEPLHLEGEGGGPGFVVCFDPVDGSSNLDVNGVVGTIFSIQPAGTDHTGGIGLGPGTAQVAAGYVMYGPATVLVLTTGDGVDNFTLDPSGHFVRSRHRLRIPSRGRIYSINEGNALRWEPGVGRYIEHLKTPDVATGRPYTARYAGSLVADLHRTLLEGGIFLYPAEAGPGTRTSGKLRLLYEAHPMALIVEQAGGRASTGRQRILEIAATTPHQRVPLIIGSPEDVSLAEEFIAGHR